MQPKINPMTMAPAGSPSELYGRHRTGKSAVVFADWKDKAQFRWLGQLRQKQPVAKERSPYVDIRSKVMPRLANQR